MQFLRQVTHKVRPYMLRKQAAIKRPMFVRHKKVKGIPIKAYTMVIACPGTVFGVINPYPENNNNNNKPLLYNIS